MIAYGVNFAGALEMADSQGFALGLADRHDVNFVNFVNFGRSGSFGGAGGSPGGGAGAALERPARAGWVWGRHRINTCDSKDSLKNVNGLNFLLTFFVERWRG